MLVSTVAGSSPHGLGQQPRVRVVVGQPLDVVVEGVQPGRGEDADLAHPAAHPLAAHPGLVDRVPRPDHQRADRGAEPLGQADGEHVRDRAVLGERRAGGDVRVPDPRAVEVHAGADAGRPLAQVAQVLERQHRAAGEVVGVLDRDRPPCGTKNGPMSGANIDRIAARSGPARAAAVQVRIVTPPIAACAPSSARAMCADDSQSTSWPGATSEPTASTLAIEPVGVNSAASWPNSPATRSSSATTVGSSP